VDFRGRIAAFAAAGAVFALAGDVAAFPHVVKKGETLASIAERLYGKVELEQLLVAANGLEGATGQTAILPGMRLEVPAVSHRRALATDTWAALADELLGDPVRSDVLAIANGSMPWMAPSDGSEIVIPWNLRYVVAQGDTLLTIAYRFTGDRDKAWMLDRYNHLHEKPVHRGAVVLVPLVDLPLTAEGREEAASAGTLVRAEAGGRARETQAHAEAELPLLAADVRAGRYTEAVARGNRLLGTGELTRPQTASIHRALVEAYVALDAIGLAGTACQAWREADEAAPLDPIELSPKILRACTEGPAPRRAAPEPTVSASASASAPEPLLKSHLKRRAPR
jgi:hypothetical protein